MRLISKKDARALGLTHYFTGKPCIRGHIAKRYVKSGQCFDCMYESHKAYVEKLNYNENWHKLNAEEINARHRADYKQNRERILDQHAAYRQTPEGKIATRAGWHRWKGRKKNAPGNHTTKDIAQLLALAKRCYLCGKRFTKSRPPEIDHVIAISTPLSTNDISNLAAACMACNRHKSARRENPNTGQGILI